VRGGDIARRRAQVSRSSRSHNSGRQAFSAGLVELAWRAWERRPQATRIESDDREDFGAWILGDPAFRRAVDLAWPVLLPWQVLTQLRSGQLPLRDLARGLLSEDETAALQDAWSGPDVPFTAADAALFDELAELLGAPPVEVEPEDDGWDELAELDERADEIGVTTHADRTAAPAGAWPRSATTGPSPTSSSTRRRTSRRCSGGCSAAAPEGRPGPSSATGCSRPGRTCRRSVTR
jgi:hypothetical protein